MGLPGKKPRSSLSLACSESREQIGMSEKGRSRIHLDCPSRGGGANKVEPDHSSPRSQELSLDTPPRRRMKEKKMLLDQASHPVVC
ncbi:hypothetical protein NPIL_494401 [Nephila pilipes]|uniref:Uncharacterized protein n=1 Tax=Nephila pilipes TaxID=299642 RepID=A0A8X6PFF2_NEPPI|nr:hypothetical protein NPIL_494401 [Nephila pilipes]